MLNNKLRGAGNIFSSYNMFEGALGELHDDADLTDRFGESTLDLNIIGFVNLSKKIAT